jgi:hypothetical protein
MFSWSEDRFSPTRSRTARYASLELRWNLIDASTMNGTTSSASSVSCHDIRSRTTSANVSSNVAATNWSNPHCTSSDIDSMSAVMRDTSTPALLRSKKPSDWRWMWSKSRSRKARRKPSPARFTNTYCCRLPT